jgi:hypothetical protein
MNSMSTLAELRQRSSATQRRLGLIKKSLVKGRGGLRAMIVSRPLLALSARRVHALRSVTLNPGVYTRTSQSGHHMSLKAFPRTRRPT